MICRLALAVVVILLASNHSFAQEISSLEAVIFDKGKQLKYDSFLGKRLKEKSVATAISLSPAQKAKILQAEETYLAAESSYSLLIRTVSDPNEEKALNDQIDQAIAEHGANLRSILTGGQRKRLAQVIYQDHFKSPEQLYSDPLLLRISSLTEQDKAKLARSVQHSRDEYLRELAALNEKYRKRVLDSLKANQRRKVDKVVGDVWLGFQVPEKAKNKEGEGSSKR